MPFLRRPKRRCRAGVARWHRHCHHDLCLWAHPRQATGGCDAHDYCCGRSLCDTAGLRRTGSPADGRRKDAATQSEIRIDSGAVHHLLPDDFVWYRPRGVHHAAHHLRHRHQERHSPRAPHGGLIGGQSDGHFGQPGVGSRRLAGGFSGKGTRRRSCDRFHSGALHHHSRYSVRCVVDWHLQLVSRQGIGRRCRVSKAHCRPGTAPVHLRRQRHAHGQGTDAGSVDRYVDFHGIHRGGGLFGCFPIPAPADRRQATIDGAHHPDVHAAGRCTHDRADQDRPVNHRQDRSFPRRHDRRGRGVRHRLDGRHRV